MFSLTEAAIQRLLASTIPSFQLTCEGSLNLGFGFIYYGLTRAVRPRHIAVIGSKAGFAPVCFALGLKDNAGYGVAKVTCDATILSHPNEFGHLSFIDPSYSVDRGDVGHSFGIGTWDDADATRHIFEAHRVGEFVTHYKMTSAEYLREHGSATAIDLLYVDGDHSLAGVTHDLVEFRPLLSDSALVLAHDVHPTLDDSEGFAALQGLPKDLYEHARIPITPGLALLRPLPACAA
ncbi:MAG: class I SAM-dependent methyltransferase [Solirubrobacteraceae bacterium]